MKRAALMVLLAGTLSAGSCVTSQSPVTSANSFCLLNSPLMPVNRAVSDYIADNDARLAEGLIAHNTYGERECGWTF